MTELAGEHLYDTAEIDLFSNHRQLAGVDARQIEEVGRELREPLDLPLHRLDEAAASLVVEFLVREQLEEATDREQRRPQLVRGVGDELLAGVVELRELDAHPVERARELADLVVAVVDDRGAEVSACDPLGGGLEPERAGEPAFPPP